MKIIGATFVFNDYEYLHQTLESFKWFPDKLFIIEGSWKSNQKASGVSERSNELTYEIINKHVDNKKVFLVQANEFLERDQRQIALELAKQEKADWFWFTDADEVYLRSRLFFAKRCLENAMKSDALGFRINSYNFINSFKKWYDGNYMRIYRVTPKARFFMDNDVEWSDKKGYVGSIPGRSFYHYNYVRKNTERFHNMMRYQNFQDETFWKRMIESGNYKEEQGKYTIPSDIPIFDFSGRHPKIMSMHPYFTGNAFGDGQLEFLNE